MKPDKDSIKKYIETTQREIQFLENDISAAEYRIKQTRKEIETKKWMIAQYEKGLNFIEE